MIGIIVAMRIEAQAILHHVQGATTTEEQLGDITFFSMYGKDFVMLRGGVGKVASACATQYLIDKFSPTKIFNFGICGGIEGEVELGAVYSVDKAVQYDFDVSEIDDCLPGTVVGFNSPYIPLTVLPSIAERFVPKSLATADRFTNSQQVVEFIKSNFNCPLRDMEGGAIAQVCVTNAIPCVMLKGVSDYVGEKSTSMYLVYSQKAIEALRDNILAILQVL